MTTNSAVVSELIAANAGGDAVKLSVRIRAATVTDAFNIDFINKQS